MTNWFLDVAIGLAVLGITEALIKPVAKRIAQRKLMLVAPHVLRALDHQLPEILTDGDGPALEDYVRRRFELLTGESWASADLTPFWQQFDPRVTADVLRTARQPQAQ
jgi:hypothetical protein